MLAGKLLARGMICGIAAALLAFAFARLFGEPQVDLSIAFEAARNAAAGESPEPELVSRTTQAGWGLLTAILMYGAAYGGLFAIAFSTAYGRLATWNARTLSAIMAALGFLAIVLIPDLKYPPNPPAVGAPETIALRTAAYFTMLAISLCAIVIASLITKRLAQRLGPWNATLCGGASFLLIVAITQALLPDISEVPSAFPATLLWRFREASIGMQISLWTTLGLTFGPLAERLLEGHRTPHSNRR